MKNITTILIASSLLSASACAGRTAYWEDKDKGKGDDPASVQTDASAAEPGDAAWAKRADAASVKEAIKHWEKAAGCTAGDSHPKERCASVPTDGSNIELLAKLTRGYYFLADGFMRADDEAYLDHMDRGVWWGERSLATASPEFKQAMAGGAKFTRPWSRSESPASRRCTGTRPASASGPRRRASPCSWARRTT